MAGGKESPRQKMIGMMYLVLTALLALQVSSAVLEKFAIINVTLEELRNETDGKNEAAAKAIFAQGEKKKTENVQAAVEAAQKVRELTKSSMAKIGEIKMQMFKL